MAETQTFPAFDRSMFIPLIDANAIRAYLGEELVGTGHDWVRIDKSEIFELQFNPQTETKAYIVNKNDETSLTSYQTAMDQEIVIDGNNQLYSLMYRFAMKFPVGSDAEVPVLLCAPSVVTPGAIDGYLWEHALITIGSLNSVDKKLTFTLNLNGDNTEGVVTTTDGGFTFTEGTAVQSVSMFSADSKKTTAKD